MKVDRSSPAYKRITSAGFTIGEIRQITRTSSTGSVTISGTYWLPTWGEDRPVQFACPFTCVCGNSEVLYFTLDPYEHFRICTEKYDVAQKIEDLGGVSVEHLREDGYSEDEIKNIRRAY